MLVTDNDGVMAVPVSVAEADVIVPALPPVFDVMAATNELDPILVLYQLTLN